MHKLLAGAAFTLLASALPAVPSHAQSPQGQIHGVVRDSAGHALSDVQIHLSPLNRIVVSNDTGGFTIRGLPDGTYHLRAIRLGYAPGHADPVVRAGGLARTTIIMAGAGVVRLAQVQVTATPTGTDPRDVAQSTTEIASEQLARTTSTSVAQSLSREPGIAVRYNGPAAATPVIRGLSGERVLVLQDGQRAGDLSATSADHALSIDPLTAERIEVVRGPASLLYGNNALGGVVNVISNDIPTSIHEHADGYVNGQVESAATGGAVAAGVTMPISATWAVVLRGQARGAGDLRSGGGVQLANSAAQSASGGAGFGYVGTRLSGGTIYRLNDFGYDLPSADDDGIRIEGRRHEVNARSELTVARGAFTSVRLAGTAQRYGHEEIEADGAIGTSFGLGTQTVDLLARTLVGRVAGAVGVSGLLRQYEATGEEALTPASNSNGVGAFVFQEIPLRSTADPDARVPRLQLGARYDVFGIATRAGEPKFGPGQSRTYTNFSGSVGLSVPVSAGVTMAVSTARAFRAPTVEELFSNAEHHAIGTYDVGNPGLVSETNQGVDGILRVELPRVHGQFSAYYNTIDNFITSRVLRDTVIVEEDGTAETIPLNAYTQEDARLRGIEGRIEVEVVRRMVLGIMGDVVRGDFRKSGNPLPFLPAARLGGLARYDDGRWSGEVAYRHAFAQTRVPEALTESDAAGVPTAAYDLTDVNVGFTFRAGGQLSTVMLRADNVFDAQYREATSRIKNFAFNPGRNLSVAFRTAF